MASDVNPRDGIGVELYYDDTLIMEVFRDDAQRTRTVAFHVESVSVEDVEACIEKFREEDLWSFIED